MVLQKMICGVVILYKPTSEHFSNIETYRSILDKLYVVDNTPIIDSARIDYIASLENTVLLSSGKNLGIGAALNLAIKQATQDGYEWLLTMDQDSCYSPEQAQKYFSSIDAIDDISVAVYAPHHRKIVTDGGDCRFVERDIVFTSGNILNLEIARQIGMFDEDLFIDSVDHEFCLRAKTKGYTILQSTNCYLNHEVGEGKMSGFFFRRKKMRWFHSPKRFYFMVRNALYIRKLYGDSFKSFFRTHSKELRKELIRSLKYSDNRWDYLHYGLRAWRDYRKGLFGNRVGL